MTMQHKFILLVISIAILFLVSSSSAQLSAGCNAAFKDRTIPIIIAFPTKHPVNDESYDALNKLSRNLANIQYYIKTNYQLNTSFAPYFHTPVGSECLRPNQIKQVFQGTYPPTDNAFIPDRQQFKLEYFTRAFIVFICKDMGDSTDEEAPTQLPSSATARQVWCNNPDNPTYWGASSKFLELSKATVSPRLMEDFITNLLTQFSKYFRDCPDSFGSSVYNACTSAISSQIPRSGNTFIDGIRDGGEQCDYSPAFRKQERVYCEGTSAESPTLQTLRVLPLYTIDGVAKRHPNSIVSGSASTTIPTYCPGQICGQFTVIANGYKCRGHPNSALSSEVYTPGACFENVGIPPPTLQPLSCYNDIDTTACGGGQNSYVWACRPAPSSTDRTPEWVPCPQEMFENQSEMQSQSIQSNTQLLQGRESFLNPNVVSADNLYKPNYIPQDPSELLKTEENAQAYTCGSLYAQFEVKCSVTNYLSSAHPDSRCEEATGALKPAWVRLTTPRPCKDVLSYVHYYKSSTVTVADPTLNDYIPYATSDNRNNIQPTSVSISCPAAGWSKTPCFGGCNAQYRIYLKCINFTYNPTTQIWTRTLSSSTSPDCSLPFISPIYESSFTNCQYQGMCTTSSGLQIPDNIQCACNTPQIDCTINCYGKAFNSNTYVKITDISTPVTNCPYSQSYSRACQITNESNHCFTPVLASSAPAPVHGYDHLSFYNTIQYNDYCKGNGTLKKWESNMQPGCILATTLPSSFPVSQNQLLPETDCPETIEKAKTCTQVPDYRYTCQLELVETTPTLVASLLEDYGFNYLAFAQSSSFAYCSDSAIQLIDEYCGKLKFKVKTAVCRDQNNEDSAAANCGASPVGTAVTITMAQANFCHLNCFDNNLPTPDMTNLGRCTANAWAATTCGPSAGPVCAVYDRTMSSKCQRVTKRGYQDVEDQELCPSPLFLTPPTSGDAITGYTWTKKCYKLTPNGTRFIDSSSNWNQLETLSMGTQCQFKSACKYEYSTQTLLSPLTGPLAQFSPENCSNSFDCTATAVCGAVRRSKTCQLMKTGAGPEDAFAVLEVLGIPHSNGEMCSVSSSDFAGCTGNQGCYEYRCFLPTDDLLSGPSTELADYTAAACTPEGSANHCSSSSVSPFCGTKAIQRYTKCISLVDGTEEPNLIKCGRVVSSPEKISCTNYRACKYVSSRCNWKLYSDNHIFIQDSASSEELCHDWIENKDPEDRCTTAALCGNGFRQASCIGEDPQPTTEPEQFYINDSQLCSELAAAAGKPFPSLLPADLYGFVDEGKKYPCNNNRACSTWACSSPRARDDIIPLSTITSQQTPAKYFDNVFGTVTSSLCQLASLNDPKAAQVCGDGEVARNVGCLTTRSPPFTTETKYIYNEGVGECGSSTNPPMTSFSLSSFAGCTATMSCSLSQSQFSPQTCQALSCPSIPIPSGSTDKFWFQHQSTCISQNNTFVDQSACDSSTNWLSFTANTLVQCQYLTDFCRSNFQIPLGFGPEANVTMSSGKYNPLNGKAANPLSLAYFTDQACSKKFLLTDIALYIPGIVPPLRAPFAVTAGVINSFSVQYSATSVTNRIQTATAYLLPVIPDQRGGDDEPSELYEFFQIPYPLASFASTSSRQSLTVPSYVPPGDYVFVLYLNSLAFKWVKDVIITVKAPIDVVVPPPAVNPCDNFPCYNGKCALVAGSPQCSCNAGFSTAPCRTPTICANPLSSFKLPECNLANGYIGPAASRTVGLLPTTAEEACDTCHCLGSWDPSDGCKTCALMCGTGKPNESCTQCECPVDFTGQQCECQHRAFLLNFASTPAIIKRMFSRSSSERIIQYGSEVDKAKYTPVGDLETAQLAAWKRLVVIELASDFNISTDLFTVVHWGSRGSLFTVVIDVKVCAGYPTSLDTPDTGEEPVPDSDFNTIVSAQHLENLSQSWTNFTSILSSLSGFANFTAPFINIEDLEDNLSHLHPSFNYTTLSRRFAAQQYYSDIYHSTTPSPDLESLLAAENSQFELALLGSSGFGGMDILSSTGVDAQSANMFEYRQTNTASGIAADSSGGFLGFGDILMDSTSLPPLAASEPNRRGPSSSSFDAMILVYIFVPLVIVAVIVAAIVLCCAFHYQKWCFEGYRERSKEKHRAEREQRKQKIEALKKGSSQTGTELTSPTTTVASNESNNTKTRLPPSSNAQGKSSTDSQPQQNSQSKPTGSKSETSSPQNPTPVVVIQNTIGADDDDDDDYEYGDIFEDGAEIQLPPQTSAPGTKRRSLHIGGLRRMSVAGLPPGWTMLMLEEKPIYINEQTMQSTRIKPNPDGSIPEAMTDLGW